MKTGIEESCQTCRHEAEGFCRCRMPAYEPGGRKLDDMHICARYIYAETEEKERFLEGQRIDAKIRRLRWNK